MNHIYKSLASGNKRKRTDYDNENDIINNNQYDIINNTQDDNLYDEYFESDEYCEPDKIREIIGKKFIISSHGASLTKFKYIKIPTFDIDKNNSENNKVNIFFETLYSNSDNGDSDNSDSDSDSDNGISKNPFDDLDACESDDFYDNFMVASDTEDELLKDYEYTCKFTSGNIITDYILSSDITPFKFNNSVLDNILDNTNSVNNEDRDFLLERFSNISEYHNNSKDEKGTITGFVAYCNKKISLIEFIPNEYYFLSNILLYIKDYVYKNKIIGPYNIFCSFCVAPSSIKNKNMLNKLFIQNNYLINKTIKSRDCISKYNELNYKINQIYKNILEFINNLTKLLDKNYNIKKKFKLKGIINYIEKNNLIDNDNIKYYYSGINYCLQEFYNIKNEINNMVTQSYNNLTDNDLFVENIGVEILSERNKK